jgi:hypothetical protein
VNTSAVLVAFLAALAATIVYNLLSEEILAQLRRLPHALLWLASRQLPKELRTEFYEEEWKPELMKLMSEHQSGPITQLCIGFRFAYSLWARRGGAQTADEIMAATVPTLEGFEDIRALARSHRKKYGKLTARLQELLRQADGIVDDEKAAHLLATTASVCEAYVDDRNERFAERLAEAARPLSERLDPDHPAVLAMRQASARTQLHLGRAEPAAVLLRGLLADEIRALGADHPATLRTNMVLAWALVGEGRIGDAEALYHSLVARVPKDVVSLRQHVHCQLSWTLSLQGRLDEAEAGYDALIEYRSRTSGPLSADTLDTRHSKGKMLVQWNEPVRACAVLGPLLADRRRVLVRNHPDTLETLKYLKIARFLSRSRRNGLQRRSLLRELHRILRIQIERHGPDYSNTRDTWQWIGAITRPSQQDPFNGQHQSSNQDLLER